MEFSLNDIERSAKLKFKKFANEEVKPYAAKNDKEGSFPFESIKKMGENGMMGIPIPVEYGGAGRNYLTFALAIEELSKACASTGVILSTHTSLCESPIYQFANEEQKKKYLPDLTNGKKIGAFGLTELNAGTDAAGQKTTAVMDGDNYILNGKKIFNTNGGVAETFVIFAMTDLTKGTKGISAFIVEKEFEGFSIGKVEDKLGIRASITTELLFEGCKVPVHNLIGKEGEGFKIAMKTLDGGRIGIAAQALGIAEAAFEEAKKYMKVRKQFGKELYKFQGLSWMMADMDVAIETARLLVYKAAWKKDNGMPYSVDAARAKLHASTVAMEVTTKAVQILGGYGYLKDFPVERMMRDAKITEIYEGTSQVQKMVISANLFK